MPGKAGQRVQVAFGVLGPVMAWDGTGNGIALKGPRHRAVLARLIVARRRVVPVTRLVEDLWVDPPPGALGAVRTFVAALRHPNILWRTGFSAPDPVIYIESGDRHILITGSMEVGRANLAEELLFSTRNSWIESSPGCRAVTVFQE